MCVKNCRLHKLLHAITPFVYHTMYKTAAALAVVSATVFFSLMLDIVLFLFCVIIQ